MKLYFFRHGHAEDADGPEFDDFARRLTDKGIERTEAAARALVKLGVKPTRLYSSPRVRARQTADILAKGLGVNVLVRDEVGFGFSADFVGPLIVDAGTDAEIMFVGHEPDLSITVTKLVGGGELVMKKGGMARVDLFSTAPLRGALVWVIPPKVFDDLAN
ncbi:MAG: histidine phosphatase family protein [Chloroflexota bacterium]